MPARVISRRLSGYAKAGHAAGFTAADDQFMSLPSSPLLTLPATGGPDICLVGWLWMNSTPGGIQKIIAKEGGSVASDEWAIQINPTAGPGSTPTLEARFSNTATYTTATWNAALLPQTWYFFNVRFHPPPSGQVEIAINNASLILANGGTHAGTNPVIFGGNNIGSVWFDGRLDAVGIFSGTLTNSDKSALYNSNLGQRFRTLPQTLSVAPLSWYDMEDGGEIWRDSTGNGFNLTAFNGVSLVSGKT